MLGELQQQLLGDKGFFLSFSSCVWPQRPQWQTQ